MKQSITNYLFLFLCTTSFSQDLGPLDIERAIEAQEFVIYGTTYTPSNTIIPELTVGYLDENSGLPGSPFFVGGLDQVDINFVRGITGEPSMNVIAFDGDGDSYDEVAAFHAGSQGPVLTLPVIDKNSLQLTNLTNWSPLTSGRDQSNPQQQIIKLDKADFDGDGTEEIVVAYRNYLRTQSEIIIEIRHLWDLGSDRRSTYVPAQIKTDDFYPLSGSNADYEAFDITVNDFNGDGTPDIALASIDGSSARTLKLSVFKVTPGANADCNICWGITKEGTANITATGSSNGWENLAISSGLYDKSLAPQKQIAVDILYIDQNDNSRLNQQLTLATTNSGPSGLQSITINNPLVQQENIINLPAMSLVSGDLDNDGSEEIVRAHGNNMRIYEVQAGLTLNSRASGSGGAADPDLYKLVKNNNYVSIGDIDLNGYLDIVMITSNRDNTLRWINVDVFESNDNLALSTKASDRQYRREGASCGFNCAYNLAAVFGEFRGGRAKLLPPTKLNRDIFTPLIVNNSPPHHFDVLENGTLEADLTDNYPSWPGGGSQGNWESVYTEVNGVTETLETELKSDWGISGTLSSDQSGLKWGVKTSATVRYGEAFSKSQINTQTITTTTKSTAKADDSVRGVLQEFDIYEYPVDSSGTIISYVLAMVRKGTPIIEWLDSKSVNALSYISDHEPGNVLSYPSDANFMEYSNVESLVKSGDRRNVGLNSLDFEMVFSDFSASSTTSSRNFGAEVSAEATYQGVTLGVEGNYSQEEIESHTSTAFSEISFLSSLNRELDGQFSDANYSIQPHAYWGKNGALTLGYTVDPSLSQGSTENFWTKYYTKKPDLSLILPWRHDPAKGDPPTDPEKVRSSKSIFLDKRDKQPGDTVIITAFIHNYSFVDYDGPVDFQFYAGRPESGGLLLEDVDGNTTLTVTANFKQRDRTPIRFNWKRPALASREPIYVVIDPDNKIEEIHEDNNIGFNELSGGVVTSTSQPILSQKEPNYKIYPNPAKDWTQVDIELPAAGKLEIALFNTQGQIVKSLYNRSLHAGKFTLPVNLSDVPAGYFFIRIHTDQGIKSLPLVKR